MKRITFVKVEEKYFDSYALMAMQVLEPYVWIYSLKYRVHGLDADDLAQELRLQLWRKLPKYDPKKAALRTWGSRVMRNRIIDLTRAKRDKLDRESSDRVPFFDEDSYILPNGQIQEEHN